MSHDTDGVAQKGEPVHCQECTAPVVLFLDRTEGFRLVCGCQYTVVELSSETASSNPFTPVTGKWSQLDDMDDIGPDWDDTAE